MPRKKLRQPPAHTQLKNTPWSIVSPDDPHHPSHKLRAMIDKHKRAALAVEDPIAYIKAHWDKSLPAMWELLLEACIETGDTGEVRETLTKMTAMSGIAPRSKVELSAGPEPDLSHLTDEEIAKLRGVAAIKEDKDAD